MVVHRKISVQAGLSVSKVLAAGREEWPLEENVGSVEALETGSLNDRVSLVTGASSGLGRAVAHALAATGAAVTLVARSESYLRRVEDDAIASGVRDLLALVDLADKPAATVGDVE